MQNLSNNHCKKSSQQTIEQNVVFLQAPEFRQVSPRRQNRFATRRIKEGERLQNACHSQRFNQNQIEGKPYALKNGNEGQRFKFLLACHRTRNSWKVAAILSSSLGFGRSKVTFWKQRPWKNWKVPGICTAAAVLLKNRDKGMSLVHYVISTILKVGRSWKRVSTKLFVFLAVVW